jgi:hypothetical protein
LTLKFKSKEERKGKKRKELDITIGQHISNLTDYLRRNNLYGIAFSS